MGRQSTIVFLFVLMLGCSGLDVKRDYDTSTDFQRIKTYAWQSPMGKVPGDTLDNNSLVDTRIRKAVNAALSGRGYREESAENVDCLIATHYVVDKEPEPDQVRTGIGLGMGSGGTFGSLGIGLGSGHQDVERETLTIDVIDSRSGKLLWRGFTEQRLERSSDPKKAEARINATAKAILSKFPPKNQSQ
jgi:hypothetical protein